MNIAINPYPSELSTIIKLYGILVPLANVTAPIFGSIKPLIT